MNFIVTASSLFQKKWIDRLILKINMFDIKLDIYLNVNKYKYLYYYVTQM